MGVVTLEDPKNIFIHRWCVVMWCVVQCHVVCTCMHAYVCVCMCMHVCAVCMGMKPHVVQVHMCGGSVVVCCKSEKMKKQICYQYLMQ